MKKFLLLLFVAFALGACENKKEEVKDQPDAAEKPAVKEVKAADAGTKADAKKDAAAEPAKDDAKAEPKGKAEAGKDKKGK